MKRAPRFIPTINVSQRLSFSSLPPLIQRSIASAEFAMEFFSSLHRGLHRPIIKVFDAGIVFKRIRRRECVRNVLTSAFEPSVVPLSAFFASLHPPLRHPLPPTLCSIASFYIYLSSIRSLSSPRIFTNTRSNNFYDFSIRNCD